MELSEEKRAEFEADPNITLDEKTGKWLRVKNNFSEEYVVAINTWIPIFDEKAIAVQQSAYAVEGVNEAEPIAAPRKNNKREREETETEKEKEKDKKQKVGPTKKPNTSVYVTGLPVDVTVEEIKTVFTKCGVIMEYTDTGDPKIKIYRDSQDVPKGDALVTYFKPESVALAIQLLDDSELRLGEPSSKISVQQATFKEKAPAAAEARPAANKNMMKKKFQKLNRKLDWDEGEESSKKQEKFAKIVILKNMFTLQDLDDDPTLLLDLKEDVREECERLGEVTNVILYDKSEGGVISVRYAEKKSAEACVMLMNNRYFAGKQISAEIYDGRVRYQKSGSSGQKTEEDEKEEQARLERYTKWLEEGKGDEDDEPKKAETTDGASTD